MTRMSKPGRPRTPTRRAFLKGAGTSAAVLVLGVHVPFDGARSASTPTPGIFDPNVFLRIDADNTVTILSKHFEMGQGITTGLATLVAEELEADWSQMRVAFAPNNPKLYNNLAYGPYMVTGGEHVAIQLLGADAQGRCRSPDHAGDGCRGALGAFEPRR